MKSTSEPPVGFEDFYEIASPSATVYYWAFLREKPSDSRSLALGLSKPSKPIVMDVKKGGRAGDFIMNDDLLYVVSQRVIDLFERHAFGKYSTFPVEVRVKGKVLPGYHGLAILGRAGEVDIERSKVKRFEDGTGIRSIDGLYFDLSKWDGSDMFMVEPFSQAMIVTRRVVDVFKKEGIKGYEAIPISKFRF